MQKLDGEMTEAQWLYNRIEETVNRYKKIARTFSAILRNTGQLHGSCSNNFTSAIASHEARCQEVMERALSNKYVIDNRKLSIESLLNNTKGFARPIEDMYDDLAKIGKECSIMTVTIEKSLELRASVKSKQTQVEDQNETKIFPIVREVEVKPTTSVQIIGSGQAFLAIDGVTEEFGGYNVRFLLADGTELKRKEFNQQGIETFIKGHLEIFGIDEVVFQVLVTVSDESGQKQTKIARKFVWRESYEKLTLKKCLQYCLMYLV